MMSWNSTDKKFWNLDIHEKKTKCLIDRITKILLIKYSPFATNHLYYLTPVAFIAQDCIIQFTPYSIKKHFINIFPKKI